METRASRQTDAVCFAIRSQADLSVATSEQWTDSQGERQERVQWHQVAVFQQAAVEFAERNIRKGDMVMVEGQIKTRSYNKDGDTRYVTEIVVRPYNGQLTSSPRKTRSPRDRPSNLSSGNRVKAAHRDAAKSRPPFTALAAIWLVIDRRQLRMHQGVSLALYG